MFDVCDIEAVKVDEKLLFVQEYFDTTRTPLSSFDKRKFISSISARKKCLVQKHTQEIMIGGIIVRHGYGNAGEFLYINEEVYSLVWASYIIKHPGIEWNINKLLQIPLNDDFDSSYSTKRVEKLIHFCDRNGFNIGREGR